MAEELARREKQGAIVNIVAVVLAVCLVAGIYLSVASSRRDLDPVTLCPGDPVSTTVLLVDVTDPLNVAQRQDFANQLVRLKNPIPRYGTLVVSKVDAPSSSLLSPVIVRCNPGSATDESDATGDPSGVQRLRDEKFDKPLDAAFERLATSSAADRSPILESMQSVALTEFQKPGAETRPRKLVVVSDLLQNTADLSFYRRLPDPASFTDEPGFRRTRTDLRGVSIELWMLERPDARETQPRALADLWDRIVTAQGGDLVRIYNVSG